MKKKKQINFKTILIGILVILVICLGFCVKDIISVLNSGTKQVEILSNIEGYGYTLNENDSEYFKEKFMLLKDELKKDKIDEENYASLISELFVIDFFSLDSSINKNDVGGIQFVYKDYQEDFVKYAKEGIYKYVENNIYKDRKQDLPLVKNTEIKSINEQSVTFKNDVKDDKAYVVKVTIEYEKDLEYPKEVELTIIHSNDKLEIAKMN